MYVADDLSRINLNALNGHNPDINCDFCDRPAVESIPVFNPADAVRGVEGAYCLINVCNIHLNDDNDWQYDGEYFTCEYCGELFITHHSWDYLAVRTDDGEICQACYIEHVLDAISFGDLIHKLANNEKSDWKRLNNIPGHTLLWEGEFSEWSDFPGHTNLRSVLSELVDAANDNGLDEQSPVYPVISHGYQFSVVLAVYF